jgi:predicted nuclease of restriction endonuclease-like (RecB) superfamily
VFPGIGGFSASNLWRIKLFHETYAHNPKLAPLVREIGWSHNIIIMERCSDDLEREFYIRMTRKFGWSKNVLIHQIDNQSYEKTLLNQTNFEHTLPAEICNQAKLAVKDEYTFDFLKLGDEYSERQLEQATLARIEPFLREMGGVFSFIGSQYRLEISDKEYFIDLLLFHRRLKCLVALELKIGEFIPEYVGKMQFYLAVLDDMVRMEDENPSIGIILCKSKDKTIVEYALRESNKPIGVAAYRIVTTLPRELRGQLPAPEQIAKLLEGVEE